MNLMSLVILAVVQFMIVSVIILIFEKLRKKLQQKYLRYVGIAAALFSVGCSLTPCSNFKASSDGLGMNLNPISRRKSV